MPYSVYINKVTNINLDLNLDQRYQKQKKILHTTLQYTFIKYQNILSEYGSLLKTISKK